MADTMTEDDIRKVVHQVMLEERLDNADKADAAMLKTVSAILMSFGMDEEERKDVGADLRFLRSLRLGAGKAKAAGITATVMMLVGLFFSALWAGFMVAIRK